jgi:hypothetical protein
MSNAKRPLPGNGKPTGSGGYTAGPKKFRGGDSEDEPSFEEELMMMDEMQVDQILDLGEDGEVTSEQQEARWARPPLPPGEDHTATALGESFISVTIKL